MGKDLIRFLEENYGSIERYLDQNLDITECAFVNDAMYLESVKVIGDDDCFDGDEFYQYVLDGDKLYKAYFDITDEDGEDIELDAVDYNHAYKIEDVTDLILDTV